MACIFDMPGMVKKSDFINLSYMLRYPERFHETRLSAFAFAIACASSGEDAFGCGGHQNQWFVLSSVNIW